MSPGFFGASADIGLGTQAVDLETGLITDEGTVIRPEHIHRAILQSIGVTDDIGDLRVDPYLALVQG